METISFNKINAPEPDYLYIQTSQIAGAGNGLYTAIAIYKDEMAAHYKGNVLTLKQAAEQAQNGQDKYFVVLPNGDILDGMAVESFAKYANDATAYPNAIFKNNMKLAFDDDNQLGIIALRNIAAGEELFCSYGNSYWKKHR